MPMLQVSELLRQPRHGDGFGAAAFTDLHEVSPWDECKQCSRQSRSVPQYCSQEPSSHVFCVEGSIRILHVSVVCLGVLRSRIGSEPQ